MSGKNVLCVDDEADLLELLCDELADQGLHAFIARSVPEALDIYANNPIDIIFSDARIGKDSGLVLLKKIRSQGGKQPFYLMTGWTDRSQEEMSALGVAGVLVKPFDLQEVVDLAKKVCSQ